VDGALLLDVVLVTLLLRDGDAGSGGGAGARTLHNGEGKPAAK
jgi:hypothetical protein